MTLRELATCPALTCSGSVGIEHAARLMAEHNVGLLCVVDDVGRPVGVLTDRDIVVRGVARGRMDGAMVTDLMTKHVVTVSEHASATAAAQVMADHQCRRLPITDDHGSIIGLVSLDDLVRIAGEELRFVAAAVRGSRLTHDALP